ncbi:MAG: carboxypeptidase-like regulatory domain-containing protein [Bacteroidetes bacterium]|nr:carboxypeptidase-like regulatory domain-containing protein [Bacteroidota bacterium]
MKTIQIILFSLCASSSFAQMGMGDLTGTLLLKKDKTPIYDARVFLMDGEKRYNTKTNPDGRFRLSAVPSGNYFVYILKDGDTLKTSNSYFIPMDGLVQVGEILYSNAVLNMKPVLASAKSSGLKLTNGFLPIKTLTSEEIGQSPIKFDIKSLASSISTDVKLMDDGSLVFRGARKGDMIYMIDGVKVTNDLNLPSAAIGKMMVYSGGLPASYGDTMGGVIVIESLSYFDLLREYEGRRLKEESVVD